ncbi:hypothetical protein FCM35_KLT09759 [Carex littledalei]|uniref:F-box domain-containing protein n=1 Tax=Carex littledalei TaxID=544730 RepID=A0A833R9B2_9POAL|nr:hypothetical protein FCM35_KLT09759 [Carex littledalei]
MDGAKRQKGWRAFLLVSSSSPSLRKDTYNSSPIEIPWIALSILSFLQVRDVLSLGSCSKYLNGFFNSDEVWKELYKRRWQDLYKHTANFKGWKTAFIEMHKYSVVTMATISTSLFAPFEKYVESEILHQSHYLKAIGVMEGLNLGFEDIYLSLFRKDISVLFNLLGLHYSFFHLGIPLEDLRKVLASCQVSDKEVCVSWGLRPTRKYYFNIPAEEHHRTTFLGQIADNDVALLYLLKTKDPIQLAYVKVSSDVSSIE